MGANSICSQLLDAGASVNKKTYMGSTPLFAAVVAGNYNTVDLLINRRADVNVLSGREAPLHIACTLNNAKMVERILQSDGVLIDILDCQRHTPLYYGYRGMEPVITGLLLSAGARIENDYGIDAAREQALSWTVSSGYFHVHPDLKKALVVLLLCYRETDHPFRDLPPELLCMLVAEMNAQMIL